MSLGNLAIKVVADISGFTSNMDLAAQSAQSSMGASSGSVDDFRTSLLKASADMQAAALAMGGNMQAANDAIVASAAQSTEAINGIADAADGIDTRTMGEKIGQAVGVGFGVGVVAAQSAWQTFSDWIEFKAKVYGLAIAAAFTIVGLGAAYTAYKMIAGTVSAIAGMIDGTFYKSENIDALIKSNDQLKDLQSNLHISAIEAGGLNEAMKRLGVDPGDYKTVYAGITSAIRSNGDELDRLGIKYKDVDGKLLDNRTILQNSKTVLDAYTEGWDRNKAAAAIGMGTYEQITSTLKVTTAEVQTSKKRLDDYQLGISAGTQDMVTKYQTAMREFSRETDLMGEGFKRVYADAVMPAYTAMANMMQEGWPSIVRATRIAVSTIVGLGYALADGLYIVKESIFATFSVIGNGLGAIAAATVLFLSGDLAGAKNAMAAGWEGAKDRIKLAGSNIVDVVLANDKAIKAAIGADDRSASIASVAMPDPTGKAWVAKPDAPKAAAPGPAIPLDDVAKRVMEGALRVQEDFIADEKTAMQARNEFLKSDYSSDLINAKSYYGERQRLIAENMTKTASAYDAEIAAIQKYIAIHKTESDKEADIVAQENKIAEIRRKKVQSEIAGNRDIALSYLDLASEKTRIAQSFLRADEIEMKQNQKNLSVLTAFRDAKLENVIEGNRLIEEENKKHAEIMMRAQTSYDLQALGAAGSAAADLYDVFKNAGKEKTALARTLFLAEKAIAVAEIIMNANLAASKAEGQFGPFGIPLATYLLASGYARAGIVAGTAIASAEGGYDIPAGTNPITQLHEKEMVLPKAQADVVRGLAKGGAAASGAITIINQTSAKIGKVTETVLSNGDRALIIQEATQSAIAATSAQMSDPNSKTSRAMARNFLIPRSR